VTQTGLDAASADVCLLAFILHELKEPEPLVAESARLLKPGGIAVVVDWRAEKDKPGPPRDVRISKERLAGLFKGASLRLESYTEWTASAYAAVGRRD
jgi:ubiquinone/menaquinone biosynthesis C-methylase UbiE